MNGFDPYAEKAWRAAAEPPADALWEHLAETEKESWRRAVISVLTAFTTPDGYWPQNCAENEVTDDWQRFLLDGDPGVVIGFIPYCEMPMFWGVYLPTEEGEWRDDCHFYRTRSEADDVAKARLAA